MTNAIYEILSRPTVIENVHQSCFRAYPLLLYVVEMVKRGDSKETIEEFVIAVLNTNLSDALIASLNTNTDKK